MIVVILTIFSKHAHHEVGAGIVYLGIQNLILLAWVIVPFDQYWIYSDFGKIYHRRIIAFTSFGVVRDDNIWHGVVLFDALPIRDLAVGTNSRPCF